MQDLSVQIILYRKQCQKCVLHLLGASGQGIGDEVDVLGWVSAGIGVSATESSQCGTEVVCHWVIIKLLTKLATASVAAQNAGGDSFHPIGRTKGATMSCHLLGHDGKRTPRSQIALFGQRLIQYNPLAMLMEDK